MKWYMALNQGGTKGDIALHTKLAVLSAARHTSLEPHLLYIGDRNGFTEWLEAHGVMVIDSTLPYMDVIERLCREGLYNQNTVGHWLRTSVCLVERSDEPILYTDVDVLFSGPMDADMPKPEMFAAAPEFDRECWNYFNAGVMVMKPAAMAADYDGFESYLIENITTKCFQFHDQIAYNTFYRGRWEKLPLGLNWKPYWGVNPAAELIHFHGPKLSAIEAIVAGRWDWTNSHGRQIGSLFDRNRDSYLHHVGRLLEYEDGLDAAERARIRAIHDGIGRYDATAHLAEVDLEFTKFRMFAEIDTSRGTR